MTPSRQETPPTTADRSAQAPPAPPALKAVVAELELHAAATGWDRPPTLYALVDTAELAVAEPGLGLDPNALPGSLTPIEQESIADRPLDEALARIAWPDAVRGCALVHEVLVLPSDAEQARPAEIDPVEWAAGHAERREVRMTVAVLREGARAAALRVRPAGTTPPGITPAGTKPAGQTDQPSDQDGDEETGTAFGEDLAPNLANALLATFD